MNYGRLPTGKAPYTLFILSIATVSGAVVNASDSRRSFVGRVQLWYWKHSQERIVSVKIFFRHLMFYIGTYRIIVSCGCAKCVRKYLCSYGVVKIKKRDTGTHAVMNGGRWQNCM